MQQPATIHARVGRRRLIHIAAGCRDLVSYVRFYYGTCAEFHELLNSTESVLHDAGITRADIKDALRQSIWSKSWRERWRSCRRARP